MKSLTTFTRNLLVMLLLAMTSLNFVSCRNDDFDEPPLNGEDPNLQANITIDSLKKLYNGTILSIDTDLIIVGTVTADDKSGNFYKTMVIEDSTAGISIRLDQSDFYTRFPIGRRVFVKLNGLFMGDYAGLIQLGGYVDSTGTTPSVEPIPLSLVDKYIVGGVYNLNPQPTRVTMLDLNNTDKWQNRFIELKEVEFDPADTAKPYADAINLLSVNRTINDCNGGSILVRSSGYCNFATKLTPGGGGYIRGIFSVYNADQQLIIRDTADVDMDSLRCGAIVGTPTLVSISTVRSLYSGSTININGNYYINGVVTSDRTTGNINSRNIFIQDGTAGICVRFSSNNTLNIGDSVSINIAGQSLGEFNGLLQIGTSTPNVPNANATVLATGKSITPMVVTVSQVLANMAASDSWEGMLIKIQGVTFTGGATFYTGSTSTGGNGGSTQVTDATGTMTLYTSSGASFASTATPTTSVNVTAILTDYSGTVTAPNTNAQLSMRSISDIQ